MLGDRGERCITIAALEVVDDRDSMAIVEQRLTEVSADKASPASN
jgi:hypothetical protein